MFTTVLLTERQLSATDVRFVTTLHGAEPVSFLVLMRPREAEAVLLRAIDDVALGAFDQAVHERGESEGTGADAHPAEALERSLAALRAAGAEAVGRVVEGHPLEALEAVVGQTGADEVVVLTAPHLIEEFFQADWASQARRKVRVPVLKVYAHLDEEPAPAPETVREGANAPGHGPATTAAHGQP